MEGAAGRPLRERRQDIDWLCNSAVLLLIAFHTARVFDVGEESYAAVLPGGVRLVVRPGLR